MNPPTVRANPSHFEEIVLPALQEHCFDCHGEGSKKGGISLDSKPLPLKAPSDQERKLWFSVWKNINSGLMPPSDKPRPAPEKIEAIQRWIEQSIFRLDPDHPDPGLVTLRRLNRSEYRNTIRDLTGVDFAVLDHFPNDDTGYGFDTIGDVLGVSPLLFEKYLDAARTIVDAAWRLPGNHPLSRLIPIGPHSPDPGVTRSLARDCLQRFSDRAFRRPCPPETLESLLKIYDDASKQPGATFESALGDPLSAILSSPRFLFRTEFQADPENPASIQTLDDFALASRLSYFLWNTTPDPELHRLASKGMLRNKLHSEVDRLIADPRFSQFVSSFVGQWLQTRDVENVPINPVVVLNVRPLEEALRIFSGPLRHSMRLETETFFEYLVRQNRPALEILNASYTFLNEPLARFYGIPGIKGKQMQKVELPSESPRRGILGHASFLVVTSNPTRTSPVKRGQFVLENLLGSPAPPPPPNIPSLEEIQPSKKPLSMRAIMERHRQDALCASCHSRMDPIGLALEDFNAAGQLRSHGSNSEPHEDRSGVLVTGETFRDARELADLLAMRRSRDFYWCLSEKILTYALGRGMEPFDLPTLRQIVTQLESGPGSLRQLLHAVVDSVAFQKRRGASPPTPKSGAHSPREN